MGSLKVIILVLLLLITCHAFYSSQHCVMNSFFRAAVARGRSVMAMMPSRWQSTLHLLRGKFFERWPWSSPMPLESDVKVSKVDWVVPPSIDTQLNASKTTGIMKEGGSVWRDTGMAGQIMDKSIINNCLGFLKNLQVKWCMDYTTRLLENVSEETVQQREW